MPDEKLTLELETRGYAEAIQRMGALSGAIGALGAGGSFAAAGGGLAAASRLGAFVTATAIATTGLAALAGAAKSAAESFRDFGRLRDTLGSSGGETAMLRAIGGALGVGDIRGLASRVRSGIGSGLGAAQAARIGIGPQLDLGGSAVNEGRILLKVLEDIRKSATRDEALVKARNFGAEELVEAHAISERLWQQILRDAKEAERLYSPEHVERGRELAITMDRISQRWGRISDGFKMVLLPVVDKVLGLFTRSGGAGGLFDPVHRQTTDASTEATQANTKATNRLADELRQTNGLFGGGARTRSAIPRAYGPGGGFEVSRVMRAHAIRLGAYAVSL